MKETVHVWSRDEKAASTVGRILISRIKGVPNKEIDSKKDSDNASVHTPQRPRSNYYANKAEVDPFPNPSLLDLPDQNQDETVKKAVEEMLRNALAEGFPKNRFDDLRKIIMARLGVFRTDFSQSSASIPPLKLELKPDAKPVHVKIRKYSDSERKFLRNLVGKLLDAGLIYANPNSKWSCAPHLVHKPGPAEWRFTVDLRPVNKYTYVLHFPMPLIEAELDKASGAKFFCEVDLIHGYWQLLLHKESQECQSFVTPDGIFTPTRVLHGNANANSHLHAGFMSQMPSDLKEKLLIWVDDRCTGC